MAAIHQPKQGVAGDAATQYFLDQARQLPGVLRVETLGSEAAEPKLVIYLLEGDVETEKRVYELKRTVYQSHPTARLDVWIEQAGLA